MKKGCEFVEENKIELHGVTVHLLRKKIKNLYIRVNPPGGEVMVSVPLYISDRQIASFLEEHWSWIQEKREELTKQEQGKKEPQYVTGETHFLWGKPYELQVERSLKKPLTELRGAQIYMRVSAYSTVEERRKQLDLFYKQELQKKLPDFVERYESIVGRHAEEWRFRRMKTRWGSCQIQKKRICLNIQLAEKPVECLEYVVVHELTHLHEAGHNKRFWTLVERFYPDWKNVKKKMNVR